MQATPLLLRRSACALAALALVVLGATRVKADAPAASNADAFPTFDNYVKIGAFGPDMTGNEAAFQSRTRQSANGAIGIEDMYFSKDLENNTSMLIDGHALVGTNDYLAHLSFTKTEKGSFDMGYKSFRTYYDGIGGFFPSNNNWMVLNPEELHVDRNQFWMEAKVHLENQPEFKIRYSNETRSGTKDSTIWGSSDFTGLSILGSPPITQYRKMAPSYINLDERHETIEGTITHTIGNTWAEIRLIGETVSNLDTRYVTNFPGEYIPWSIASLPSASQPAAKAAAGPQAYNNQAVTVQSGGIDGKTFTAMANTVTTFSDSFKLLLGFSWQNINNGVTDERPIATTTPTAIGAVVVTPNTNQGMTGNIDGDIYTLTGALDFKPTANWNFKLWIKGEDSYVKSTGTMTNHAASLNTTTGVVTYTDTLQQNYSRVKESSWTPGLDFSYSGFSNVTIYGTISDKVLDGDKYYATPFTAGTTPSSGSLVFEDNSDDHFFFNFGANWRACKFFSLRAEVFHKDEALEAKGYGIDVGNYFNLASQFSGVKLTAIVKPTDTLTSTTRYIYQKGKMQVTGLQPTFPEYDSCDAENNTISETIDWNPNPQWYVQLNANLVLSYINTVYPRAGVVPAAGATPAWNANQVLQNSNNNYFNGSLLVGNALSKTDDVTFQYFYYISDNYDPYLASITMPYGAASEENMATIGIKHKFTDRCVGEAKLGYIDSQNDTTGGRTSFHGPMGYVSLTFAL